MQLTGGQMVVQYLISEGIEHVFAIPGHGNTALLDAFVDHQDEITVHPAMHEQGAAHMADGYYPSSGKLAVAIHTLAPAPTTTHPHLSPPSPHSIPFLR